MTPIMLLAKIFSINRPDSTELAALQAMEHAWAPSTWRARCSLWTRFRKWATSRPMNPITAVAFIKQVRTATIQGKHPMSKTLKALFGYMGHNTTAFTIYQKSLVAQGALIPLHQAKAIMRPQVLKLSATVRRQCRGTAIAVKTSWKICGRWMETASITPSMCPVITPTRIVIAWGQKHKSGRQKPFSKHMFTVIEGEWTAEIAAHLKTMQRDQPLSKWSTQKISNAMKKLFGKEYSSHSLKHGAITFLLGLVAKGILTLEEVARLAKHENVETTIRYGGNPEVVALALGTQRATVHT